MSNPDRARLCNPLALATALAVLAGGASAEVRVTSLQGAATAAGSPLSLHASVPEGASVEVAEGGRCSLLLGDQALVRVCGDAAASFAGAGDREPGRVDLEAGTLKAVAGIGPDDASLAIRTPTADIVLRGASALVTVSRESGETVVSALDGPVRVTPRHERKTTRLDTGEQLTLRRRESPGDPRSLSRESLARSACSNDRSDYRAAVRAERRILSAALPAVSTGAGQPPDSPATDLERIVRADFPEDGLPLEESSTPSALVSELSKRGMDEEICDPITCNPVYRLAPPPPCGDPPVKGCIP